MSIETLDLIYTSLLYLCAFGQAVFVVAWLTVPWYKTLVGCALMAKSFSLTMALVTTSALRYTDAQINIATGYKIYIGLFAVMFLGISFQDFAIFRELWLNKKYRNDEDLEPPRLERL